MSSITLNRIIDQCADGLLITAGKKNPATEEAAHRIIDLAWDAYKHEAKIEPLSRGFIVSRQVKNDIAASKGELDRLLPICKRIAILAERDRGRRELDRYSRMAIGLGGVSLLVPVYEEGPLLTSRPAIFAMAEFIGAYAIQSFKHWRLPNRDSERTELGCLWMELDGSIPLNINKASEEMRSQMLFTQAIVNYASIRLRVQ
ncbi:MAG: hypothetical protein NTX49_04875 [Chlamydiae bacterium]|nr:hypothetical protein [Chlamydiota bacterium]